MPDRRVGRSRNICALLDRASRSLSVDGTLAGQRATCPQPDAKFYATRSERAIDDPGLRIDQLAGLDAECLREKRRTGVDADAASLHRDQFKQVTVQTAPRW
jgi:hypothetical protein